MERNPPGGNTAGDGNRDPSFILIIVLGISL
jgi:hypothetical protein